jgi:putative transcriptional regulator
MNDINTAERSFSELVAAIRQQLALSQEDLARQLGVSYATVNRWENGHNIPSRLARTRLHAFCEEKIDSGKLVLRDGQRL